MSQIGFDFGKAQPRRLVKVTPSKLSTFDDCPRRYRMAYLDRPAPRRTGAWAHSTLGAVVHNALRAVFDLPAAKRTAARAAALVNEQWSDAGFADAVQAARYRERARGWVSGYLEQHDLAADPVGVERWVSTPISAETGRHENPTMIIEGRADRIDLRGGELVIVDYKTGKWVPDEQDVRGSQALALYAVAAARTLRMPCHRVELHHLPSGTVAAAEHTPESLHRQIRRAGETADDIAVAADTLGTDGDGGDPFPTRPGRRCSWCDFRPSCAEGQQAAPAMHSDEMLAP